MLCANGYRGVPRVLLRLTAEHQDHPRPPRHSAGGAATNRRLVKNDRGGCDPFAPAGSFASPSSKQLSRRPPPQRDPRRHARRGHRRHPGRRWWVSSAQPVSRADGNSSAETQSVHSPEAVDNHRKRDSATPANQIKMDGEAGESPEFLPEKGRPPPGGEEARVVVYQPRGVGLMHTRRKPGNAHYTHETAEPCKSRAHPITLSHHGIAVPDS